jgi:hypothetical protein
VIGMQPFRDTLQPRQNPHFGFPAVQPGLIATVVRHDSSDAIICVDGAKTGTQPSCIVCPHRRQVIALVVIAASLLTAVSSIAFPTLLTESGGRPARIAVRGRGAYKRRVCVCDPVNGRR